jgi:hypothetical protein
MGLEPSEIDLDGLPRTLGGGLKREPVEELLRRVQWEYSQLYFEHKKLKDTLELSRPEPVDPAEPAKETPLPTSIPPESQRTAEVAEVARFSHAPRREPDEVGRVVLASAYQAAREVRESARHECELMIKKTHARIAALERDFERRKVARAAALVELDAAVHEIREQMRLALESLRPEPPVSGTGAVHELFPAIGAQSRPAPVAQTER